MQRRARRAGGERWLRGVGAVRGAAGAQPARTASTVGQRVEEEEGKLPAPSGSLVAAGAP